MHEKRRLVRKRPPDTVLVVDLASDIEIGRIVNLTPHGLLLLSEAPIPVNRVFQLRILLPKEVTDRDAIEVGAESLWDSPASDENKFWTGFQIIDIAERDSRIIEETIGDWNPA